jgi:hypothetical protein
VILSYVSESNHPFHFLESGDGAVIEPGERGLDRDHFLALPFNEAEACSAGEKLRDEVEESLFHFVSLWPRRIAFVKSAHQTPAAGL